MGTSILFNLGCIQPSCTPNAVSSCTIWSICYAALGCSFVVR